MKETIKLPTMLPIRTAAKYTPFCYESLRKMVQQGKVKAIAAGTRILVNMDSVREYLERGLSIMHPLTVKISF